MHGEVAYRQLVLRDNGEVLRLPLTAPINDLLGQLRPSARGHEADILPWLSERYRGFRGLEEGGRHEVQQAFLAAARKATKGQLAPEVARHLERLRFNADGSVEVGDFAALAAWSLIEAVRRQSLELRTCAQCKGRWLAAPTEPNYCQRVAPGQVTRDCRTLARERRLAGDARYRAYRREYKRLAEAQRRGAIDVRDVVKWREENGPKRWLPFDQWNQQREEADHG